MQHQPQSNLPDAFIESWYLQLADLCRLSQVPRGRNHRKEFIRELLTNHRTLVQNLWKAYNFSDRRIQQKKVAEAPFAISYVLGFHLNNLQRHHRIIGRLKFLQDPNSPLCTQPKLLDIGCGAGAWSQAATYHLSHELKAADPVEVDLIDRSRFLLMAAETGVHGINNNSRVRSLHSSFIDKNSRYVLDKIVRQCREERRPLWIGFSYLWNELSSQPRILDFLGNWLIRLNKEAFPVLIFFMEPGREKEAREAQQVRHLFQQSGYQVAYPCPSSHVCPMMTTPENWCYSEVENHRVPDWQPIADSLQLHRKVLAAAAYVFANGPALQSISSPTTPPIVVGRPTVGDRVQLLCCDGFQLQRKNTTTRKVALRGLPRINP